ncbi:MAG: HAD family hydrolase [Proteobacteria bacterium]|nr:HAD family hydrolase [Pseudomonadota bacterium]
MAASTSPIIAVFDFDNTLTNRDSLVPFLFHIHGFWKTIYHFIALIPAFTGYFAGALSRQQIKERILTRFIGSRLFGDVQALGKIYADQQLDRYLKPEALKRLTWHQAQGHRCLLVSASLEFYLKPWAKRHGFEKVIASRLELTPTEHITGRLIGLNCWGPEKKRRLLAYLDSTTTQAQFYVYGDSRGDHEILALADYPFYRKFK